MSLKYSLGQCEFLDAWEVVILRFVLVYKIHRLAQWTLLFEGKTIVIIR